MIRAGADYRGESYRYRLYTDTLSLSSAGVPTQSDIGGSRGGTLDILPARPDPEPPAQLEAEPPLQLNPEPEPPTQPEPEPVPLVQQNPDPVLSIQPASESTAQSEPPQDSVLPAVVQQPQAQVPEPEPSSTPATPEPLSPVQPANVQPPAQPKNQPVDTEPEGLSPAVQIAAGAAVTCVLVAVAAAKPAAPLNWLRRLLHRL